MFFLGLPKRNDQYRVRDNGNCTICKCPNSFVYLLFPVILLIQYMDEAMYLMQKRNQKFTPIFPQDVVFLDGTWSQLVDARYKAMEKDKKAIKSWKCLEELLDYCWGLKPLRGRSWSGTKFLYAPFNVANRHWMAMVIDIKFGHIHLFDCDHAAFTADQLKPYFEPLLNLVPKIIQQCKLFTEEESPNMNMSTSSVVHVKEIVLQTKKKS